MQCDSLLESFFHGSISHTLVTIAHSFSKSQRHLGLSNYIDYEFFPFLFFSGSKKKLYETTNISSRYQFSAPVYVQNHINKHALIWTSPGCRTPTGEYHKKHNIHKMVLHRPAWREFKRHASYWNELKFQKSRLHWLIFYTSRINASNIPTLMKCY